MKKVLVTIAMSLTLGAGLWAMGQSTTQPATQPIADGAPVNKFCAVIQTDEVDPKIFIMYQGKKIGFCCPDCSPEFLKDPQKYLKTMK